MMGTSLLSMPWAINQAGFVNGIVLLLAMAALMLYTSYRILKSVEGLCKYYYQQGKYMNHHKPCQMDSLKNRIYFLKNGVI